MLAAILYVGAVSLLVIGLAGMLLSSHLFRMLLGLVIAEAGANLLLVLAGYRWEAAAPIWESGAYPQLMVDPVPQAMVLTAIVIGVGIQALAIALLVRIRQQTGSLQRDIVREQLEQDLDLELGVKLPSSMHAPSGEGPLLSGTRGAGNEQ